MSEFATVTAEEIMACLKHPARTVQTAAGPMEVAEHGEGPVLLSVHGGPGGCDQGLIMADIFRKNGFKVLAVSRPGYLGTPLATGESLEAQADALAALLDALELDKAAVVGASAGGPSSYLLAQRHPHKVAALMELDSVSMTYTKADDLSKAEEFFYLSKPGLWLMDFFMRHFPKTMVKEFLESESTLDAHELGERVSHVVQDPVKLAFIQAMTQTMVNRYEERKAGVENDLKYMRALDRLPLDNVVCPTLIVHGTAEGDVPLRDAQYAHGAIAGSELYLVEKGSHVGFWISDVAEQAQRHALEWLRKHHA